MSALQRDGRPDRILTIHASAMRLNGEALVFLGPSETGKSTVCRLLSDHGQFLADDRVHLVRLSGERWGVANADNGIRLERYAAMIGSISEQVPLHAIFRLHQAAATRLERVEPIVVCRYLVDALFEVEIHEPPDVAARALAFAALAQVARTIPGYRLDFELSPSTAEAIQAVIGQL